MGLENLLCESFYKSIKLHYDKADYTEAVRDAMFFVSELVREKSGLYDKDGVKLFESAFLGKNPALKINDGNSETENNIQEGVGFILKGMTQMIRNPISHEKILISKSEADSILLFTNVIIKKIDNSSGKTLIENYMDIIGLQDFTSSREYSELLVARIPVKKRLELLFSIFEQRGVLKKAPLVHLIASLVEIILPNERKKLIELFDDKLLLCKPDDELAGFVNIFFANFKDDIDAICRLRIQDLVLKSVVGGDFEDEYDFSLGEEVDFTNDKGLLAESIADYLLLFQNREEIVRAMYDKLTKNFSEEKFVLTKFNNVIFQLDVPITSKLEKKIRLSLDINSPDYDERYVRALEPSMSKKEDNQWKRIFGDLYRSQDRDMAFYSSEYLDL